MWKSFGFIASVGVGLIAGGPVRACYTALLLAVDVSNSVDAGEYEIQAQGIAAALADPVVIEAMVLSQNRIAIMHWSGPGMQEMVLPWTQVQVPADMLRLSAQASQIPRAFFGGNTAVGEAITVGLQSLQPHGDCTRRVIDISGDGSDNAGSDVSAARRLAERQGVTINGLAIEGLGRAISTYYASRVITSDGFVETAFGFLDFARAMKVKIRREISRVIGARPKPRPSPMTGTTITLAQGG